MKTDYPKNIFAREDGFLFQPWHRVFEQVCQASGPSDRAITKWQLLFESRRAWCEKRNIRYITFVIPERHVIYEDRLPHDIKISQNRAVMKLKHALKEFTPDLLLYPEAELKQARSKRDVFLKTDEHLSQLGNYTCYKFLFDHLADLGLIAHAPEDYSVETFQYTGNIGLQIDSEPSEQAEDWRLVTGKPLKKNDVFYRRGEKCLEIARHEDAALPKAVFFGDSNLEYMKKFLNPHFSKTITMSSIHKMFYDLVSHEQPDLVVHVMSEHRLGYWALNHGSQPPYPIYSDIDMFDFESYCDMSMAVYEKSVIAELSHSPPKQNHLYFLNGWHPPEKERHWMTGTVSKLALDFSVIPENSHTLYIEIEQTPFLKPPTVSQQRIKLSFKAGSVVLDLEDHIIHEAGILLWKIDASVLRGLSEEFLVLTFEHPDGVAPSTLSEDSPDHRILSFSMSRMTIYADA